ncbi:mannose-1-phosphate guanylyltransferase [Turicibacter sanguinis]|uniref:mannose-1-phosphate guanylyltransferase n=1 Tax=Turicibacter sanguinis TaxID=154288 RepID=UPI0021D4E469|nr:mannose-1-phosphate guanylyltransferase [Turicibacter sanguinis]MCU7197750.1 mannose-1-phosphate guanylyltransferase [Turicibacter sanguinis]
MLCALIMAGGKGTRFWPLSTEDNPKQFLNLLGKESMIQMTVNRLTELIPMERIFIVTDQRYKGLVNQHLPQIPLENIIIEPVGMNTAPCIALSAMIIEKKFSNSTLAVLPSDHLIENTVLFRKTLEIANLFVETHPNAIVTLGMTVSRPEVGYGYIKYQETVESIDELNIHRVKNFVEKPDVKTATHYMNEGNYLWNGGMFIWKSHNVIELTKEHLTKTYELLQEIVNSNPENFEQTLLDNYPKVENISVDYGIMEKAKEIFVIPSDFGWDDIGSWLSLERYRKRDEHNNILDGKVKALNSKGNIILTQSKPMVLCGVENLILVETDEVIMVMKKNEVGKINQLRLASEI